MVPPRHRIPTPAWAELPTDATSRDSFHPFANGSVTGRAAAPVGAAPFGSFPETQPILGDDDNDAPRASPF